MTTTAYALFALLAFSASSWGWGQTVLSACRLQVRGRLAYATMLGLAALGFLGGWANLAGIAYPPTLWALLAGGWVLAIHRIWLERALLRRARFTGDALACASVIAIVAIALAATLLPGGAFNPGDDLQLYFYRPVRMLQAGSLGQDPFDPMGFDSLGIHAFLQGFTLLVFPLSFLNAFDAVLCAGLALALTAHIAKLLNLPVAITLCGLAALMLMHPQQVNVSAVYATAALLLALVPATAELLGSDGPHGAALWQRAIPAGLLVAALTGLKVTNLTILLPAAVILFALTAISRRSPGAALRCLGALALCAGVFLSPWLGMHLGHYAALFPREHSTIGLTLGDGPRSLLTVAPLHWGGTVLAYNVVALIAIAAACGGALRLPRQGAESVPPCLIPLVALCGAAGAAYLGNSIPFDVAHAVRYSAPALLAGLAGAVLLLGHRLAPSEGEAPPARLLVVAVSIPLGVGILFASADADRVRKAIDFHSTLSEPGDMREFTAYSSWSLGSGTRAWVRKAQAQTRPGERILALIACPHHLLFARNPVLVASEFGLTMPWLGLPLDANAAELRRFLRRHGVRYVLWQAAAGVKSDDRLRTQLSGGYAEERRLARYLLSFRASLAELTRSTGTVHRDEGLMVIDLGRPGGA